MLSSRLNVYERLWHALHPSISLETVCVEIASHGFDAAVQEIRASLAPRLVSDVSGQT